MKENEAKNNKEESEILLRIKIMEMLRGEGLTAWEGMHVCLSIANHLSEMIGNAYRDATKDV